MNLVTNFWLWRSSFGNRRLWYDPQFETYREKFPCLARLLLFSSYLLSFHIFRLSYSRLFGKKCFDARFKRRDTLRRLLTQTTVFSFIFVCMPAAGANAYNLFYVGYGSQVWYIDVDGLAIVGFELILSLLVVFWVERSQSREADFSCRQMWRDFVK